MQASQPGLTRDVYTVTRLNREVRAVLEGSFPTMWVQGEISNLAKPASGHLYFSLKDKHSQVRCAMFKNRNQILKFLPENGIEIIAQASVSLYEGRGEFQLIINQLEPAGIGALQLAFEQLKQRLQLEGLFDQHHKNPLPRFPRRIGVITSPSGAAIRDVLQVLQRRFPFAGIIIYPVPVQGQDAATLIAMAIENAGQRNECDVIILARGGGSIEDLWSFNDEKVARAIFKSKIPLVTGIGHEIDFTISDFVADSRASTPSAAAELVSPDQHKLTEVLDTRQRQLMTGSRRKLQQLREQLNRYENRLPDPVKQLQTISQHLDDTGLRMIRAVRSLLREKHASVFKLRAEINQFNPLQKLRLNRQKCGFLDNQLRTLVSRNLTKSGNQLDKLAHSLHTISPLATLDRGYAIVTELENGRVIRNVNELEAGNKIKTMIANGMFQSTVTGVHKNNDK